MWHFSRKNFNSFWFWFIFGNKFQILKQNYFKNEGYILKKMAAVAKKCYYWITSEIILFDFYSRWVLVPWLILYSINICLLCVVAVYLFINPVPVFQTTHAHYELLRLFGLVPIGAMIILGKFINNKPENTFQNYDLAKIH